MAAGIGTIERPPVRAAARGKETDMGKVNLRELVLDALLAVTRDGEYSHVAIRAILDKHQYLEKQERSFIKRVCEGTLEHMIWIDYVLDQFSKVKAKRMKPVIRCILRSGVYELRYMDSIPPSATCDEAVKLAKKRGFGNLSGFVNGVLRSVSRNLGGLALPSREENLNAYLSVRYSMPEWILEMWESSYPVGQVEGFLQAFLEEAPTSIRVNPARTGKEELKRELEEMRIRVSEPEGLENALLISGYDSLGRIPAFREGKFYVQDVSSMHAALWAEPKKGAYVMDVCAAPGGKSLHIAELMEGTGLVEARDLTERKVSLIRENIRRCRMENISAVVADARVLDESRVGKADLVMADLPCSGLGVLGKKADIKYRMTKEACGELAALQREILHTVQQYVKPGGVLLYSTCTINASENEENVAWFLREHPQFILERQRQIFPQAGKQDGFFLARLTRRA